MSQIDLPIRYPYLLAESQAGSWSAAWSQRAIAAVTRLQTCSRPDPLQADTMILVAGALAFAGDVIGDTGAQWPAHQQRERERWLHDRPILAFGKEARRQRALRSWRVRGRGPSIPAAGSAPD
ncbi:MAG: hypothetical protein IT515_10300 [Burkholderiales bacterium]|nr:hypothetical protein [Burkholderiales bacterium]